jgi:acetyl-CoA carboxylase biotin carboxyl carrier protein
MGDVVAELAANVWRVLARAGDRVAPGDTLAILESMKMEIPVEAPAPGVVTEVRVVEGGTVQEGDVIAVVE